MSIAAASLSRRHAATVVLDRIARFASAAIVPPHPPADAEPAPPTRKLKLPRIRQKTDASGSAYHFKRPLTEFNASLEREAERGDLLKLVGQMRRMQHEGRKPDVLTYEAILKALANEFRAHEALDVLEDMSDVGVEPNLACFNLVLKVRRRHSDLV